MNTERTHFVTFDGLDATGKTTLTEMLQSRLDAVVLKTPPDWIRPLRETFNRQKVEMRFLYYAFGNLWVDRFVLRPFLDHKNEGGLVLQDRSWLSTLSAHELRGMSRKWLDMGVRLARMSVKPDISLILHVDPTVRYERLMGRGLVNKTDLQNMEYENQMENKYFQWAGRLEWNPNRFDNTNYDPINACEALARYIRVKYPFFCNIFLSIVPVSI